MTGQGQPAKPRATTGGAVVMGQCLTVQFAPCQAEAIYTGKIALPLGVAIQPERDLGLLAFPNLVDRADSETGHARHGDALQMETDGRAGLGVSLEVLQTLDDRPEWTAVCCPLHDNVFCPCQQTVKIARLGDAVKSDE